MRGATNIDEEREALLRGLEPTDSASASTSSARFCSVRSLAAATLGASIALFGLVSHAVFDASFSEAVPIGNPRTTVVQPPACVRLCLVDGIEGIELDSTYCSGMEEPEVERCIAKGCSGDDLAMYSAFTRDTCYYDAPGEFPDDIQQRGPFEVIAQRASDSSEVPRLGRDRPSSNASSATEAGSSELKTFQCDFERCGASRDGFYQYVDVDCGSGNSFLGIGCEGTDAPHATSCRACYTDDEDTDECPVPEGLPRCPQCVCEARGLPPSKCAPCSGWWSHFQFRVTAVRGGYRGDAAVSNGGQMQFSDLLVYDEEGKMIAFDVNRSFASSGASAAAATDGSEENKFVDFNFQRDGSDLSIVLAVRGGHQVMSRGYELFTADDAPSRDPVSWTLSGAKSAEGPWTSLVRVEGANAPSGRDVSYGFMRPCDE